MPMSQQSTCSNLLFVSFLELALVRLGPVGDGEVVSVCLFRERMIYRA